jgi:hypothetical protein
VGSIRQVYVFSNILAILAISGLASKEKTASVGISLRTQE